MKSKAKKKAAKPEGKLRALNAIGGDFGPNILAESQHWAVVWARIVALSWEDASFKQALLGGDPKKAIYDTLNYVVNPALDLRFCDDPNDTEYTGPGVPYENSDGDIVMPDTWDGFPQHKPILYLPQPPQDQKLWAIAVAEFADTGRTYPFTSL
jgi:ribosomally synthesized peptide (two-chain TOMM family)